MLPKCWLIESFMQHEGVHFYGFYSFTLHLLFLLVCWKNWSTQTKSNEGMSVICVVGHKKYHWSLAAASHLTRNTRDDFIS